MASNLLATASNLLATASNLLAMASNLDPVAMASNLKDSFKVLLKNGARLIYSTLILSIEYNKGITQTLMSGMPRKRTDGYDFELPRTPKMVTRFAKNPEGLSWLRSVNRNRNCCTWE